MSIANSSNLHQVILEKISKMSFFSVSLLLHILIVAVLGSAVLVREMVPKETFTSTADVSSFLDDSESSGPPADEPVEFEEMTFSPEPASTATAPASQLSALATESVTSSSTFTVTAATAIPSMGTLMSSTNAAAMAIGSGGTPSGGRGGGGGLAKQAATSRKFFNTEITVNRLGVLVDYSGSMTPYHSHVWKEVEGIFDDGVAVVQGGCGMANANGGQAMIFEVGKPVDNIESLEGWNRGHALSMPKIAKALPGFLTTKGTAFFLGEEKAGMQALETFKANGVDTVYWFGDFGDHIGSFDEIERFLKSNKMKLFIQYPKGQGDVTEGMQKSRETLGQIAKATGGGVIEFDFQLPAKK